jgi:hypothetical protein
VDEEAGNTAVVENTRTPFGKPVLVIRNAQLEALRADMERCYLKSTARHLRTHYTAYVVSLTDDALDARVRTAYQRARGFGLVQKRNVSAFIAFAVVVGEGFEHHPRVKTAMGEWGPPDYRFDTLCRVLRPGDWESVARSLAETSPWP